MTTPAPWSMNSPDPMRAAGWISMPVTARTAGDGAPRTGGVNRPRPGAGGGGDLEPRPARRGGEHHPRPRGVAAGLHRVGEPVGEERLDAGPRGEQLGGADTARGGVAVAHRREV